MGGILLDEHYEKIEKYVKIDKNEINTLIIFLNANKKLFNFFNKIMYFLGGTTMSSYNGGMTGGAGNINALIVCCFAYLLFLIPTTAFVVNTLTKQPNQRGNSNTIIPVITGYENEIIKKDIKVDEKIEIKFDSLIDRASEILDKTSSVVDNLNTLNDFNPKKVSFFTDAVSKYNEVSTKIDKFLKIGSLVSNNLTPLEKIDITLQVFDINISEKIHENVVKILSKIISPNYFGLTKIEFKVAKFVVNRTLKKLKEEADKKGKSVEDYTIDFLGGKKQRKSKKRKNTKRKSKKAKKTRKNC